MKFRCLRVIPRTNRPSPNQPVQPAVHPPAMAFMQATHGRQATPHRWHMPPHLTLVVLGKRKPAPSLRGRSLKSSSSGVSASTPTATRRLKAKSVKP